MNRTHDQNERRCIAEEIRDKEARRFQKTRMTTAIMRGLCEEIYEKSRGEKKWREKDNNENKLQT